MFVQVLVTKRPGKGGTKVLRLAEFMGRVNGQFVWDLRICAAPGLGLIKIALKPGHVSFKRGHASGLRPCDLLLNAREPSNQAKRGPCSIQIAVNMARKSTGTGKRQQWNTHGPLRNSHELESWRAGWAIWHQIYVWWGVVEALGQAVTNKQWQDANKQTNNRHGIGTRSKMKQRQTRTIRRHQEPHFGLNIIRSDASRDWRWGCGWMWLTLWTAELERRRNHCRHMKY